MRENIAPINVKMAFMKVMNELNIPWIQLTIAVNMSLIKLGKAHKSLGISWKKKCGIASNV